MKIRNIKHETGYKSHSSHNCIDVFKKPEGGKWINCPNCGLEPLVWEFDNGRKTACGCWRSKYFQHSVLAESILSVHKRTNGKQMNEYDSDALRKNWNHWCKTGEHLFIAGNGDEYKNKRRGLLRWNQ